MAGEDDTVVGIKGHVTRGLFGRGLGYYLGPDTRSWQLVIAHTGSSFFPSHCPMRMYPGVSQGREPGQYKIILSWLSPLILKLFVWFTLMALGYWYKPSTVARQKV